MGCCVGDEDEGEDAAPVVDTFPFRDKLDQGPIFCDVRIGIVVVRGDLDEEVAIGLQLEAEAIDSLVDKYVFPGRRLFGESGRCD